VGGCPAVPLEGGDESILHLWPGVIGTRLPLDVVAAGIDRLAPELAATDAGLAAAAKSFRQRDSTTKAPTVAFSVPDEEGHPHEVRVTGIAKGVGMIHPRMATM